MPVQIPPAAQARQKNTTGAVNTAFGYHALYTNVGGGSNTAFGSDALQNNSTGGENTAVGKGALSDNSTGSRNIALGMLQALHNGGRQYTYHHIGTFGDPFRDSLALIRVFQKRTFIAGIRGIQPSSRHAIPVLIESDGQLGTVNSSRRFKDNIADMDAASSALMQLRPVTFLYKSDQNPAGRSLQYGLIAEEVAEVYPGLVAHSADGQIETVMYQHLPPMLLNEVQKQHRAIESLRVLVQTKDREIDALRRDLIAIKRKLGLD
ncbi:MAG: tail fiber domain-containing protein [Betaproteobacteria bacterium]|nr:tail fiber domain-containing protein [Betaproteobacteria bacterium]